MRKTHDIGHRKTQKLIFWPEEINICFKLKESLNSKAYLDLLVTKAGPALKTVAREHGSNMMAALHILVQM